MSIRQTAPVTTIRTTFICDHCDVTVETMTEVPPMKEGLQVAEPEPEFSANLPDGWQAIHDPRVDWQNFPEDRNELPPLVFHQRTCMSLWLGDFVHQVYGGADKPTKIRRSRKAKTTEAPPHEEDEVISPKRANPTVASA